MLKGHTSYRSYLKTVLAERMDRNPSYSLRAFASQLEISHSALSETINGRGNFSSTSARKIAQRLELDPLDTEFFCLLVQFESTRDPVVRGSLLDRINALNSARPSIHDLSSDRFRQISDWYHAAILEYVLLDEGSPTSEAIAERLGISRVRVEAAIERMIRLDLLYYDEAKRLRRREKNLKAQSQVTNGALKSFYLQMLEKTKAAVEEQAPGERYSGFETLAFSRSRMKEAREIIDECFDRLIQLSERTESRSDVYHVSIHFFNLTPKRH